MVQNKANLLRGFILSISFLGGKSKSAAYVLQCKVFIAQYQLQARVNHQHCSRHYEMDRANQSGINTPHYRHCHYLLRQPKRQHSLLVSIQASLPYRFFNVFHSHAPF